MKPRAILFAVFLGLGLIMDVSARLGETETELDRRYGQPVQVKDLGNMIKVYQFRDQNWSIEATVFYGNCHKVVYRGPYDETKTARDALLQANSQGRVWIVPPPGDSSHSGRSILVPRSDGLAYAELPERVGGQYVFYTQKWADWVQRLEKEKAAKPKPRPNF